MDEAHRAEERCAVLNSLVTVAGERKRLVRLLWLSWNSTPNNSGFLVGAMVAVHPTLTAVVHVPLPALWGFHDALTSKLPAQGRVFYLTLVCWGSHWVH